MQKTVGHTHHKYIIEITELCMESLFSGIDVCVMICLCMAPANFCKVNYLHVQCVCEGSLNIMHKKGRYNKHKSMMNVVQ